jgi:hypothetical protein
MSGSAETPAELNEFIEKHVVQRNPSNERL